MMTSYQDYLADQAATENLGQRLAVGIKHIQPLAIQRPLVIYLHGPLGAAKSAMVRAVLHALGVDGTVRSPTYTLLETYAVADQHYCHMDLYRLADPEELEFLGVRECLQQPGAWFVEWPEQGEGALPAADIIVTLDYAEPGRQVAIRAMSSLGESCLGFCT